MGFLVDRGLFDENQGEHITMPWPDFFRKPTRYISSTAIGPMEKKMTRPGKHTKSYWKWPFIVSFPIKKVIFHSYVSLPEDNGTKCTKNKRNWKKFTETGGGHNWGQEKTRKRPLIFGVRLVDPLLKVWTLAGYVVNRCKSTRPNPKFALKLELLLCVLRIQ